MLTVDARNQDLDQHAQLYHVTSENNNWTDLVAVSAHSNMGYVFDYFFNTHGRKVIDDNGSTIVSIIHEQKGGRPMTMPTGVVRSWLTGMVM